jgi:RHS repeat-associated protein
VRITASVVKYYAFGSQTVMEKRGDGTVRWSSGTLPTDKTVAGQRAEGFGLMDYKARYYSPDLGHFIQADTLIPGRGIRWRGTDMLTD